jgi:hypothetical protein
VSFYDATGLPFHRKKDVCIYLLVSLGKVCIRCNSVMICSVAASEAEAEAVVDQEEISL